MHRLVIHRSQKRSRRRPLQLHPAMGRIREAYRRISSRYPAPSLPSLPDHMQPSNEYLITCLLGLSVILVLATIVFKQQPRPKDALVSLGVSLRCVAKTVREIEQKAFGSSGACANHAPVSAANRMEVRCMRQLRQPKLLSLGISESAAQDALGHDGIGLAFDALRGSHSDQRSCKPRSNPAHSRVWLPTYVSGGVAGRWHIHTGGIQ